MIKYINSNEKLLNKNVVWLEWTKLLNKIEIWLIWKNVTKTLNKNIF